MAEVTYDIHMFRDGAWRSYESGFLTLRDAAGRASNRSYAEYPLLLRVVIVKDGTPNGEAECIAFHGGVYKHARLFDFGPQSQTIEGVEVSPPRLVDGK